MKTKLSLLFGLLFFITTSYAATYYVRTDGNDLNNSGTSNTSGGAWRTIKYAVSKLNTGDVLLINDGYYFEPEEIKLEGKVGSNTNRIIIKAINRRKVKIESNSLYHAIAIVNCVGVTIEGLEVTFQANTRSDFHGMNLDGSNRITVKDCWVHHAPFSGIQGSNSDNIIVENCLITDNCKGMRITENGSGISIAASADREANSGFHHILRNNIIYNNEANSNVASTGAPTDGNGIIFDYNNAGTFNFTYPSLVENNLIYKNGGRGIHVFLSKNVTIRNNTCYYNNYVLDRYGWYCGEIQVEGPGCSIYNNIAVEDPSLSSNQRAIKIYENFPPCENNLFVGDIEGTIGSTNIIYAKGSQANVGFVNASTDPATADFHLQSSSPAVNAGNNSFASSNDLDNVTRPVGGTVDIGCYEYSAPALRNPENPASTAAGLEYKYYEGSWSDLPNFDALTAAKQGNVTSFDLAPRNRNDNFGFAFTGFVEVPSDGTYTFYTTSDDGSKLFIGSTQVVNNDGVHAPQERSGTIGLKAGRHAITVTFFEATVGEVLTVSYSGPGVSKQTIPASALSRSSTSSGFRGTYKITARHSSKALDVSSGSTADGANVQQWTANGTGAQQWIITATTGGYYKIVNKGSSKALEVAGSGTSDGSNVQQWSYIGANNQQWSIEATTDGFYRLLNRNSGKALDVNGGPGATQDGVNVHQWGYLSGTNQQWKLELLSTATARTASAETAGSRRTPEHSLQLHPNPASREVTISLAGFERESAVQVSLSDMAGKAFLRRQVQPGAREVTLSVGHLPRGVFVVRVRGSKTGKTAKLVITR